MSIEIQHVINAAKGKMKQQRLSMRQAAKYLDLSPTTVCRLLGNARHPDGWTPDLETIVKLAGWSGASLGIKQSEKKSTVATLGEIEVLLSRLPGFEDRHVKGIMAMIREFAGKAPAARKKHSKKH